MSSVPFLPDPQFAAKLRDVGARCQRSINEHLAEARPMLAQIGVPADQSLRVLLIIGSLVNPGKTPAVAAKAEPAATAKPRRKRGRPRKSVETKAPQAKPAAVKPVAKTATTAKPEPKSVNGKAKSKTTSRGGLKRGALMPNSKMAQAVKFASAKGNQPFKVEEFVTVLGVSRDEAHKILSAGRKKGRFTKVSDNTWRGVVS